MSQKKFAQYCGVSAVAINKAIKEGRVIATDKLSAAGKKIGKEIDLDDPVNMEYYQTQADKKSVKTTVKKTAAKKTVKKKVVKSEPKKKQKKPDEIKTALPPDEVKEKTSQDLIVQEPQEEEIPEYLLEMIDTGQMSMQTLLGLNKYEVDKIKSYYQIQKIKVDTGKARKELVSRKIIRTVFSKLYEIDLNQFLTLKDKLMPDISAIAGVNDEELKLQIGERMDEELWKVLDTRKYEMNKYLLKVGEEEI